ncbi:MAG TPA: hypothetical protein VM370_03800 [Candidatus Thermoplasmatota archaeon]|nr:hypothetical protein [Candidatus Thermoplasmatota archaeon]
MSQGGGDLLGQVLRGNISEIMGNEQVVVEVFRDLLKDEVKRKMREELEKNPELQEELRDAIRMYFEAKVRETYATMKFMKASAKLGVQMMPGELREELGKEIGSLLEKEVAALLEKAL